MIRHNRLAARAEINRHAAKSAKGREWTKTLGSWSALNFLFSLGVLRGLAVDLRSGYDGAVMNDESPG